MNVKVVFLGWFIMFLGPAYISAAALWDVTHPPMRGPKSYDAMTSGVLLGAGLIIAVIGIFLK